MFNIFPENWNSTEETRLKMEWIIRLRWVAIIAQGVAIIPAVYYGYLEESYVVPYAFVILILLSINLVFRWLLPLKKEVAERDLLLQLMMDMAGLTILLLLTGGAANPFLSLLFLHASLGALILKKAMSIFFLICIILSLLFLQFVPLTPEGLGYGPTPRPILFISYLTVAMVTWRLTVWLSETLQSLRTHVYLLRERKDRVDRLRAVGALASGFSHEFATPLNTIKLRLARLERHFPGEKTDLRAAMEAAEACEKALRSLNDSRIHSDHLTLTVVHLPSLVKEIAESWRKNHPAVKIEYFALEELLSQEKTFPTLLPQAAFSQIVVNLLDNCAEAKNSEELRIQITFSGNVAFHCFQMIDNGAGFPDLVFRQWGEPFVTTKPGGTGLGLYNALSLAQALGGEFKIKNNSGGGACVEFCLPRKE